jgi:hypothetical protein
LASILTGSRVFLAQQTARASDADGVVEGDRCAVGAARFKVERLVAQLAESGLEAGEGLRIVGVAWGR